MQNQENTVGAAIHRSLAAWCVTGTLVAVCCAPLSAQDMPSEVTGKAVLSHPAGKAVVAAGRLLAAGKLAEVRKGSVRDLRDDWAAMSETERRDEATRLQELAPEPRAFEAEIAQSGVLTLYGDSAKLWVPAADGKTAVAAFVSLEDGKWLVTGGPTTVDTAPAEETAPEIQGADILDHELGKLALDYAAAIEEGRFAQALELSTAKARAKRLAESAEEQREIEKYLAKNLPKRAALADQIRSGGRITFEGDQAYLMVSSMTQTPNADGSTSYSSSTFSIGFALEDGRWKIAG